MSEQNENVKDYNKELEDLYGDIQWMRRSSRKFLTAVIWESVVILILIAVVAFFIVDRPKPVYFASTPDLRVAQLAPMSVPLVTDDNITQWANNAVIHSLSIDFVHWQDVLASSRKFYTKKSFDLLIASMKSSGLLKKVVDEKLDLSVVSDTAPIITNEGVLAGVYSWQVKFPVKVTYEGSSGPLGTQTLKVTMIIQRADTRVHPSGVVIQQIVME